MILFKCDRCGKLIKTPLDKHIFTVYVTHPESSDEKYYEKYYDCVRHFCTDCMDKIQECIEELGRAEE